MTAESVFSQPQSLVGVSDTSDWLTVDQEHLSGFAHATYLDPAYVDLTPSQNHAMGPSLVDGFMLLSLLVHFDFATPLLRMPGGYGFNYGLERVRFTAPVFVDEAVRLRREVIAAEQKSPTRVLLTFHTELDVQREHPEVAMVATWLVMAVDGTAENRLEAQGEEP